MKKNYHLLWFCLVEFCFASFEGNIPRTSLTGVEVGVNVTSQQKIWRSFQALGNIAFAFDYSQVLIDIQASFKFWYFAVSVF